MQYNRMGHKSTIQVIIHAMIQIKQISYLYKTDFIIHCRAVSLGHSKQENGVLCQSRTATLVLSLTDARAIGIFCQYI